MKNVLASGIKKILNMLLCFEYKYITVVTDFGILTGGQGLGYTLITVAHACWTEDYGVKSKT